MNVWQFLSNPFSAFAAVLICFLAFLCLEKMWNRWMRHLNIKAHGWPPKHLDSDGNFKGED